MCVCSLRIHNVYIYALYMIRAGCIWNLVTKFTDRSVQSIVLVHKRTSFASLSSRYTYLSLKKKQSHRQNRKNLQNVCPSEAISVNVNPRLGGGKFSALQIFQYQRRSNYRFSFCREKLMHCIYSNVTHEIQRMCVYTYISPASLKKFKSVQKFPEKRSKWTTRRFTILPSISSTI